MPNLAQFGNDLYTGKRSIDFIGRQKTWYAVSAVLIVLALVGILARGLNFGIEFRGGSEYRISGVTNTTGYEDKARDAVAKAGIPGNVVTTVIGGNTIRVQTEAAGNQNDAAKADLAQTFNVGVGNVSASLIGPSWGESVSQKAIQALVVFLILVALVMAAYFRTWKMAVAGLVALIHDLIITVGVYALFGFEITPSSMIGFLTILGYSLYDTVVVFDKVRENTAEAFLTRRQTYTQAANLAVNRPSSVPSTPRSWRCCRSPRSSSSASPCSARAPCSTSASRCSSASASAPTRRSSSPPRCWSTCGGARRRSRSSTGRRCATSASWCRRQRRRPLRPARVPPWPPTGSAEPTEPQDEVTEPPATAPPTREVHKWASSGPRNQPRRTPKSKR